MTIHELKTKVEAYRNGLKKSSGKMLVASEDGPIGIPIIDDLVLTLEAMESRIEALESRPSTAG